MKKTSSAAAPAVERRWSGIDVHLLAAAMCMTSKHMWTHRTNQVCSQYTHARFYRKTPGSCCFGALLARSLEGLRALL